MIHVANSTGALQTLRNSRLLLAFCNKSPAFGLIPVVALSHKQRAPMRNILISRLFSQISNLGWTRVPFLGQIMGAALGL